MANTEGLSDEVVSSMLAMPSPEEEQQQRFSRPQLQQNAGTAPSSARTKASSSFSRRALARREQMMELGEGEMPAARVIRSSKPPKIRSSSSTTATTTTNVKKSHGKEKDVTFDETAVKANISIRDEKMRASPPDNGDVQQNQQPKQKPVMLSTCIRERPVVSADTNNRRNSSSSSSSANNTTGAPKKESRFKQRNRKNNGSGMPTVGGFPSLDIAPVGTFTRKGKLSSRGVQDSPKDLGSRSEVASSAMPRTNPIPMAKKSSSPQVANAGKEVDLASQSMLANMSQEEILDGVDEVTSILSADSIAFLRKRGRQKLAKSKESAIQSSKIPPKKASSSNVDATTLTKFEQIQLEEEKRLEGKEKMAELLSSVRTPEDMDRVYKEALQLGIAAQLPSSSLHTTREQKFDDGEGIVDERLKNLHTATSLLRSTAPRQRLLGARSLCEILEEDVKELCERRRAHSFSGTYDERNSMQRKYPQLLPVAVRCLLDESIATFQTSGGRLLLSIVLRCIHALMTLFVHPYHAVNVCPAAGCDDPYILYQTCFMSDISHVPPGTEFYPPTQIKPLGEGDADNASCYRADSSAASAESDSKAFYNDPAWTLLSRMRILPCLSDVLLCLSADYSTGVAIPDAAIRSICGILAMLAVRSPGAAGATARHKGILPFLVSYCLSPSDGIDFKEGEESEKKDGDDNVGLFRTGAALPALVLLCHLARQSRDIAELEMPFQTIVPDLQAILCVGAETNEESGIQIWSLVLLRILMRYGLAIEHVQSLINIAAPRVELMRPESSLGAHYLLLFANICDASKVTQQNEEMTNMPAIFEADNCLAMSGVWLSSSVRSCATSFKSVVNGCDKNNMKFASAQLRLLASYISTAAPTMGASSIPIVSKESCFQVIEAALESDILDNALNIALGASFNAYWVDHSNTNTLEEEAIACSFVSSFTSFVQNVALEDLDGALKTKLVNKIIDSLGQFGGRSHLSTKSKGHNLHPACQSWFIESEFSVFSMLCEEIRVQDSIRSLLLPFAFSLVGRLNVGHEAMAAFIFRQEELFQLKNKSNTAEGSGHLLRALFLGQLSLDERKLQLIHSSNIFTSGSLSSLRCTADFVGKSNNAEGGRFLLPLGAVWMYNVLSSTMSSQSDRPLSASSRNDEHDRNMADILSHALQLLLQLETAPNGTYYTVSINNGTKLYHITNMCLFPEKILSNDLIGSSLEILFKHLSGTECNSTSDSSLVKDFIKACFEHSRLSQEPMKRKEDEKDSTETQLYNMLTGEQSASSAYSKDELKALDDFIDDLCNSYIEYGGQYPTFTNFIRLFLRHDFPAKTITAVLTKLHPILHVLTIEEEDKQSLVFSLTQSISGGLPSLDSSRRDPSSVLDSFSTSLKKRDKELTRNDYVYLLAIAVLSRNLASSSQRCDCGLQAMKNRLSGVSTIVFYDITQAAEKFLRSGGGTKDSLISCVFDICMGSPKGLNSSLNTGSWDEAITSLKNVKHTI